MRGRDTEVYVGDDESFIGGEEPVSIAVGSKSPQNAPSVTPFQAFKQKSINNLYHHEGEIANYRSSYQRIMKDMRQ
jgi:hypothetical protein